MESSKKPEFTKPFEWVKDPRRWSINLGQRRLRTSSPNWWKAFPERLILSGLAATGLAAIDIWARRMARLSPKHLSMIELSDHVRAFGAIMDLFYASEGLHSPADDDPEPEFDGRKLSEMSEEEMKAFVAELEQRATKLQSELRARWGC